VAIRGSEGQRSGSGRTHDWMIMTMERVYQSVSWSSAGEVGGSGRVSIACNLRDEREDSILSSVATVMTDVFRRN
jgi:hypothetical protein